MGLGCRQYTQKAWCHIGILYPAVYMKGESLVQKPPALPLLALGNTMYSYREGYNRKKVSQSGTKVISFNQLSTSLLFIPPVGETTAPILDDLPLPYESQCSFEIKGIRGSRGGAHSLQTEERIHEADMDMVTNAYEGYQGKTQHQDADMKYGKLVSRPMDIDGWTTLRTNITSPDWPRVPLRKCYVIACKVGHGLSRVDGKSLMGAVGGFSLEVPLVCTYGGYKLNTIDNKFFSQQTEEQYLHNINAPYLVKRCESKEYVVSYSTKTTPYKANACVTLTESQKKTLDTHIQQIRAVYVDATAKGTTIPYTIALVSESDRTSRSLRDVSTPYPDFVAVRKGYTQEDHARINLVTDNIERRRNEISSVDLYRFVPGSFREQRPPSLKPISFWFYEECK